MMKEGAKELFIIIYLGILALAYFGPLLLIMVGVWIANNWKILAIIVLCLIIYLTKSSDKKK